MRVIKDTFSGQVDVSNIQPTSTAVVSTRPQSVFDRRISHDERRVYADSFQVSVAAELRIREQG